MQLLKCILHRTIVLFQLGSFGCYEHMGNPIPSFLCSEEERSQNGTQCIPVPWSHQMLPGGKGTFEVYKPHNEAFHVYARYFADAYWRTCLLDFSEDRTGSQRIGSTLLPNWLNKKGFFVFVFKVTCCLLLIEHVVGKAHSSWWALVAL